MINYKEMLDNIIFENIKIDKEDLDNLNEYGIESPVSKAIIIYYYLKLNISDKEKSNLEKEVWQLSKQISSIAEKLLVEGEIKKAKEITTIKNRTINCFFKFEGAIFSKEEKEEKGRVSKVIIEKEKKSKSPKFLIFVLSILLFLLIIILRGKSFEEEKKAEESKIEIVDYDFSKIIETVNLKLSFRVGENLYMVIDRKDEEKVDALRLEVEKKLAGIAEKVIIQDENGKEIINFPLKF